MIDTPGAARLVAARGCPSGRAAAAPSELDPEIAAGDHRAVRRSSRISSRLLVAGRPLDLGDHRRAGVRAGRMRRDVSPGRDERGGDQVHPDLGAEGEIDLVLAGHRRDPDGRAGKSDTLVVAQLAAVDHPCDDVRATPVP